MRGPRANRSRQLGGNAAGLQLRQLGGQRLVRLLAEWSVLSDQLGDSGQASRDRVRGRRIAGSTGLPDEASHRQGRSSDFRVVPSEVKVGPTRFEALQHGSSSDAPSARLRVSFENRYSSQAVRRRVRTVLSLDAAAVDCLAQQPPLVVQVGRRPIRGRSRRRAARFRQRRLGQCQVAGRRAALHPAPGAPIRSRPAQLCRKSSECRRGRVAIARQLRLQGQQQPRGLVVQPAQARCVACCCSLPTSSAVDWPRAAAACSSARATATNAV